MQNPGAKTRPRGFLLAGDEQEDIRPRAILTTSTVEA